MDGAWTYLMSRHLKRFLWFCQNIWWAVQIPTWKDFFLFCHHTHNPVHALAIESTNIALIGFLVALFINLWKYLSKPTFIKCFKLVSFLVGMWLIVHWLDKRKQLPKMFPSQPNHFEGLNLWPRIVTVTYFELMDLLRRLQIIGIKRISNG